MNDQPYHDDSPEEAPPKLGGGGRPSRNKSKPQQGKFNKSKGKPFGKSKKRRKE